MAAAITGEIAQPAEPATHEAFLKVPRNSPAPNHSLFNTLQPPYSDPRRLNYRRHGVETR